MDDGEMDGPEAAETTGAAHDGEPNNLRSLPGGEQPESIKDRAEQDAEEGVDEDGQKTWFFVEESGKKVSLGQLVNRSVPTEYRVTLGGKAIPHVKGGMIDPFATSIMLVADCVVGAVKPTYIRDGDQKVEKVIVYMELKPRVVQQAFSEAGQVLLAEGEKAQAAA